MKRVLVFAGAGASCAVNSEVYPTTQHFFERLPELDPRIVDDPFFGYCAAALGTEGKPVDIEQVLWETERSIEALERLTDANSALGRFIQNDLPGSEHRGRGLAAAIPAAAAATVRSLDALRSRINACVFKLYGSIPKPGWLSENWTALFSGILQRDWLVDIATTNYDLVVEEALNQSDLRIETCYDGSPNTIRRFAMERLSNVDPDIRGRLYKLHGSVNWQFQDDGSVVLSGTNYTGFENRHALIYPGFKGAPRAEPFSTLHDHISRQLPIYDAILFIGFAFRDEYLNSLFGTQIREDCFVAVIDKAKATSLPRLRTAQIRHFGADKGFGGDSIASALQFMDGVVASAIEPSYRKRI